MNVLENSKYEIVLADGHRNKFVAHEAVVGLSTGKFVFLGFCALFMFLINIWAGVLGVILFTYLYKKGVADHYRKAGRGNEFIASPIGVEVGGKTFACQDIHRIIIRNGYDGSVVHGVSSIVATGSPSFVAGAAFANGMSQIAAANAAATLRTLSSVGFRVEIEAGGQAYLLAGGLSEPCAYAIFKDVQKACLPPGSSQ